MIIEDESSLPDLARIGRSFDSSGDLSCVSLNESEHNECTDVTIEGATTLTPTCQQPSLPPLPTQTIIICILACAIRNIPSIESLDEYATLETFTRVFFEGVFSLHVITIFRLLIASIMLGQGATVFLWGFWEVDAAYLPGSKLTPAKSIRFRGALHPEGNLFSGLKCVSFFTLWCWFLEGVSFLVNGLITLHHLVAPEQALSPWIYRSALIIWEIAAPSSILVSTVVTYVIWPFALKQEGETKRKILRSLKSNGALMQHNLNSVAALVEVTLMGRLPVVASHFAIPLLYGIVYIMFTYSMAYSWTDKSKGPQFIYPVFDTTLGATVCSGVIAAFVIALLASLSIFHSLELLHPLVALGVTCITVCRFR